MRILIATDAWHPQVNGVVRTLTMVADALRANGVDVEFLTPDRFRTFKMPTYPDIRLSVPFAGEIARAIAEIAPTDIHIATEGPLGHAVRRYCLAQRRPFTTSFHTRFAEYVSERVPVPESWVWAWLRRFHSRSAAVMAATPALRSELQARGFPNVVLWPRGVDSNLFHPRMDADLHVKRPVFLSVGRVAVEKNIAAFLSLDLPGTKVVVGDGPARAKLEREFPDAVFLGEKFGEDLAEIYAAADVFVFPSKTDTYGLVLLEALACGIPVAAFPVTGPRDVIGDAPVAVLDRDLRKACIKALSLSRDACRDFALARNWESSATMFAGNIIHAHQQRATRPDSSTHPAPDLMGAA